MTLSFSVVMGLLPDRGHGSGAALFELSRGLGAMLGPLLAGIAIEVAEPLFPATEGYAAIWVVAAVAVLASVVVIRGLDDPSPDSAHGA